MILDKHHLEYSVISSEVLLLLEKDALPEKLQRIIDHPGFLWQDELSQSKEQRLVQLRNMFKSRMEVENNLEAVDHFLSGIVMLEELWLRPLSSWSPGDEDNLWELYASIFSHLLLAFDIPRYFLKRVPMLVYSKDFTLERTCLVWALILGQGKSLRQFSRMFAWPIPKTFTMKLYDVPEDGLSFEGAVCWALSLSLGGTERDCDMLDDLGIYINPFQWDPLFQNRFIDFWFATARWVIRHSIDLDEVTWSVIWLWAQHKLTESLQELRPFSWKGRTPVSVHRAALRYQRQCEERAICKPWPAKGWDWQQRVSGLGHCSIVELTSSEALQEEGRVMDHCVSIYNQQCSRGDTAIFSCRVDGERRLTIEVKLSDLHLSQVFGRANRLPTKAEMFVVDIWKSFVLKQVEIST